MAVQIIVKNSNVEDKRPTASQLANGEIALNYNAAGAFLTCKDTNGDIQQVGGVKINDTAPDSPPIQCLWFQPSSLTLFVYDGNSWLPVAGGGGGTPGGGDITQIIGNQGIDANEIAGIVTLDVELDGTNCGLKFNSSKLSAEIATADKLGSVKIGEGIDVAIDGTISVDIPQTLVFRGSVDLNNPPSGQINPDPALSGDAYVVTLSAPSVATGWTGIVGDTANAGDLAVFDGNNWELIGTGGTMQNVEGGDGIQASVASGVATVAVDLADTDAGLEFDATDTDNVKLKASIASDTQLGSVKVGDGLSATTGGVLSVDGAPDLDDGDGATFDGRYVKIAGPDSPDNQTITGTGGLKTAGLLESAGGVKVTGASADGFAYFTDLTDPNFFAGNIYIGGDASNLTDGPDPGSASITLSNTGGAWFAQGHIKLNTNGRASFVEESSEAADGRTHFLISGAKRTAGINETALSVKPTFITTDTGTLNAGNNCFSATPTQRDVPAFLITGYRAFGAVLDNGGSVENVVGFNADQSIINNATRAFGFFSNLASAPAGSGTEQYNFYAAAVGPNFFAGNTYIGGNTTRNTFDLWKSTLTEEQLEQLEAGTLVAPANVALPGDGSFARQWYYDRKDAETQALLDSGELEYPEHLAAATFTDTFALGDNTNIKLYGGGSALFKGQVSISDGTDNNISLNSDGTAQFKGDIEVGTGNTAGVVLTSPNGTKYRLVVDDAGVLSTVAV